MPNPFEQLGKKRPKEVHYDEWAGMFSCDTLGCYEAATIAKYIKKEKVLTWVCPEGHISVLENVDE